MQMDIGTGKTTQLWRSARPHSRRKPANLSRTVVSLRVAQIRLEGPGEQQKAMLLRAYSKTLQGDQKAASNLISLTLRIRESTGPSQDSTEQ